ncbi:unnamed protein product [Heterobilharzia americana]|nr:unnamed protein product [Heterobilharzia americana]
MEHNYDFSGEENNMAQGTVPHMDYYNQYPMNSAHIHGPHFDHTYNTLHNSNYNLGGTGEKYSNIHSSPKQQLPSGSTSESFGYPVDFGPGFSLNEKSPTQGKGVLDIPPDSSPNGEYLVDFRNSNENESTHETSTELLKSNQVQPRTELTKIGKTTRHSASTTQKPKVPRQLATDRNVTKVHTSSRLKKNQQDLPIESASESLQQPDPFAQWYQMMSQYYNQFYPGYQMVQQPTLPQQSVPHRSSNRSTKVVSQPQELQMPSGNQTGSFDYVNYYYQYYAAAAAAQMWSGAHPSHLLSTTVNEVPRFYNTPHIKAWMGCPGVIVQILPSRPLDGELARVELIDLSELADEAVADAAKRAADTSGGSLIRTRDPYFIPQQPEQNAHFSITDSGMQTPSRLSSIPAGGAGDEDTEEMRACAAITACWDRVDHVFYPGPLDRVGTLKADVLAFLREKLSEIQDRLPIDWESAALLLMFLEALVKNNGNLQTSDLVHLLLEGHEPTTSTFRSSSYAGGTSNSYLGVHAPIHYSSNFNHFSQVDGYMNESLISLPSSQVQSGRTSPDSHFEIDYSATSLLRHGNKAASETGGLASVQNIIRRVAAVNIGTGLRSQESEDKLLDRFRELLMHGLPIKALEHACRSKLWGHAFTLAHRLGPPTFMKVMDRFMNNDISMSDPILTLYQLTAGEMPQVINSAAYGKGCDSGDWRPHLAMILATHSTQLELSLTALERLGDGLLSRKHIYAAHLCYLLMNTLKYSNKIEDQREFQLPAKIWLIGVPPYNDAMNTESIGRNLNGIGLGYFQSPLFATSEAIQLTEIYEYASQLANRKYRLRQLLPFRLIYAIRLLDAGLVEKAYQYLKAIGNEILLEFDENLSKNNFQMNLSILYYIV